MPERQHSEPWARIRSATDLGAFLAEVRASSDLTQDEVAERLGISRRYLYEIESGKPSLYTDRLFALLRLYGVTLTAETRSNGTAREN
ncbi:DNA-binding protein [Intrasporangium oryzae NRRL B-24470]|uniref:DNA-binding protein n=1 Tax=Intrasporangium oryzae NRRL B-24470 TaxID=1386089 RepID=W9GB84_9MICO|nr:DNA-binding protein [Intrasporangium oryzae NRRL B-24470]